LKLTYVLSLAASAAMLALGGGAVRADQEATCPVSGHKIAVTDKTTSLTVNGQKQYFCCADCPKEFVKNPGNYLKGAMTCPVMTSNKVNPASSPRVAINDNLFFVCCGGCPNAIVSSPQKYIKETRDPVSGDTFQVSENSPRSDYKGVHYLFSSEENKKAFDADPGKYSNKLLSKEGQS
jgi:YHS domain-containing protein